MAQAEAVDGALVEMAARYEAMDGAYESRQAREPTFEDDLDRLFDAIATWCPRTLRGLGAKAKVARLSNSDALRGDVLAHVEALADLPTTSPATPAAKPEGDTLEGIGRAAHVMLDRMMQLEEDAGRAEMQGRRHLHKALHTLADQAYDSIYEIQDRGLDVPARSLGDVLAGLVAISGAVSQFSWSHEDHTVQQRMEAIEAKVQRRIYGLRGFVECLAGLRSDQLCGALFLASDLDPFTKAGAPPKPAGSAGGAEAA